MDIIHYLINFAMSFLVVAAYLFFYNTATNLKKVTLNAFIGIIFILIAQIVVYYIRVEDFQYAFNIKAIRVGWGNSNNIALLLGMFIPICFYKVTTSKYSTFFVILACLSFVGILMTLSRGIILICGLLFIPMMIVSYIFTKQKIKMIFSLIVMCIIGIIIILLFSEFFEIIKEKLFTLTLDDNGRLELFKQGFNDFKLNPIFGVGFYHYFEWYHNTILQIIASTGIVGTLLFIPFFIQRYFIALKKFNICNFFMMCSIVISALYGLIECNFFFIYNALFIVFIYIIIEKEENTTDLVQTVLKRKRVEKV